MCIKHYIGAPDIMVEDISIMTEYYPIGYTCGDVGFYIPVESRISKQIFFKVTMFAPFSDQVLIAAQFIDTETISKQGYLNGEKSMQSNSRTALTIL